MKNVTCALPRLRSLPPEDQGAEKKELEGEERATPVGRTALNLIGVSCL